MTTIKFGFYEMPSIELGELNKMPDIKNVSYIHAGYNVSDNFDDEDKRYLGKGLIDTMLPYMQQDGYGEIYVQKKWKSAIIENEKIRAIFLPELGGRLWSLFDKVNQKELLYVNKVFKPGNLALRNAWFSGGIEWNVGIKGHNPLTASPMFTTESVTECGAKVLIMYEYERIRGVVYSVNAILPDDSDVLYIKTTVENTKNVETYMYWWSNIAVPDDKSTRVITPSDEVIVCHYNSGHYDLNKLPMPDQNGVDDSYPTNSKRTTDYFYKLRNTDSKWIAAVNSKGYGLLQTSTPFLKGRKLFTWGGNQGGKNWNDFLSGGNGDEYIEIQAGLLTTQLEHILMPANSKWEWTETYGSICGDKNKLHSNDWDIAIEEVQGVVNKIEIPNFKIIPSDKIVYEGSSWGYLESKVRKISDLYNFNVSKISLECQSWLELLEKGIFREESVENAPISFMISDVAKDLLLRIVGSGKATWNVFYQLGVIYYANGDNQKAIECWEQSILLTPNAWSERCLAMLYYKEYNCKEKALTHIFKAFKLGGNKDRGFMCDYAEICLNTGNPKAYIDAYSTLDDNVKKVGRLKLYLAVAHYQLDDTDAASKILNKDFYMPDIKEGELSVTDLWFKLYDRIVAKKYSLTDAEQIRIIASREYPLPRKLDFRMD